MNGFSQTIFGRIVRTALVLFAVFSVTSISRAEENPDVSARNFFKSLNDKDYSRAWKLLSKKSQDGIVAAIATSSKLPSAQVKELFKKDDQSLQSGFWDSFRASSKADQVLQNGTFTITLKKAKLAKVSLSKKVDLLMFNEAGWRFGFLESFFPQGYTPQ